MLIGIFMHTWPFYSTKSAAAGLRSDPLTILVDIVHNIYCILAIFNHLTPYRNND